MMNKTRVEYNRTEFQKIFSDVRVLNITWNLNLALCMQSVGQYLSKVWILLYLCYVYISGPWISDCYGLYFQNITLKYKKTGFLSTLFQTLSCFSDSAEIYSGGSRWHILTVSLLQDQDVTSGSALH